MKYFKTRSLDEAVFLTIKGVHHLKVKAIGQIHSEWTFEESKKREFLSTQFWSGNPSVNLNKWIMIRQQLKFELKNLLSQQKPAKKEVERDLRHPNGTEYWFINAQKKVQHATYGKAKSHNKRIDEGNFFLNRIQAVAKQNES